MKLASSQLQICSKSLTNAGSTLKRGVGPHFRFSNKARVVRQAAEPDHRSSVLEPQRNADPQTYLHMKNKFSTRFAGRRGFCPAIVLTQTWVGQHGFINLRALLGLTLGLSGVALAIFAGKDGALQRPS